MRVHNPRSGEVADRLSVLSLKLHAAMQAGKSAEHFEEEKLELLAYVEANYAGHGEYYFFIASIDRLLEINWQIWQLIDLQHRFEAPDKEYASWSRETVRLNDLRAALIKEINGHFGVVEGDEKI